MKTDRIQIDGVWYVKEKQPVIINRHYNFELHPNTKEKLTWCEAQKYVKSLGEGWRLPSIEELFMIYNEKIIVENSYWSSSEINADLAWYFFFTNGLASNYNKGDTSYVRAVKDII
jgi:hypothetical protein